WDLPGAPLDFVVVVTFAREGSGTRTDLHITFANDAAMQTAVERYGVLPGGVQTFERLAFYLER
ncbi:MAG: ATPase, partial [Thermoanaerobaculia bacterium]